MSTGVEVYGVDYPTPDGTCIRDFIHVADLADAHLAALRYLRSGGASTTLNCGYGLGHSVLDVIETVKRVSAADFPVAYTDRREGDAVCVVASSTRIREKLGWRPRFDDLTTIVGHALAWERQLANSHGSGRDT
jgi:UDP-glucose 4-epimerase